MRIPISPMEALVLPILVSSTGRKREMDAVVDTGATYLVITTEDAIDLGFDLASAPRFPVISANGIIEVPRIIIERVYIGKNCATNVAAVCLDMAGDRVSALLGMSVLQHFKLTINYKEGYLEIEDP